MKTAQEMTYDFMLALAPLINKKEIDALHSDPHIWERHFGDEIVLAAKILTRKYLETL